MAWSRSASDVMTMAFLPLVSANRVRSGRQPRKRRAVSTEPVRMTAPTRGSVTSPRPVSPSGHGRNWRISRGTPASQRQGAGPGLGGPRDRQRAVDVRGAGERITIGDTPVARGIAPLPHPRARALNILRRPLAPAGHDLLDPRAVRRQGPVGVGIVLELRVERAPRPRRARFSSPVLCAAGRIGEPILYMERGQEATALGDPRGGAWLEVEDVAQEVLRPGVLV